MNELIEKYLDYCLVAHMSKATIVSKREKLTKFLKFCLERSITKVTEANKELFLRYQKDLFNYRHKGKPLSLGYQIKVLSELKIFFNWLLENDLIVVNHSTVIKVPRKDVRLPRDILTEEEIDLVFNAPNLKTAHGIRDRAILECLYSTAIRRMELANLQVFDVKFEHGLVFVKDGKGRKDRVTPIGQSASDWIMKYLDEARDKLLGNKESDYLFLSFHGRGLERNYITELVRGYFTKVGITKPGATHQFRHACATHLVRGKDGTGGMNVKHLSTMLGHASLSSTEVYLNLAINDVKKAHQKFHPKENE